MREIKFRFWDKADNDWLVDGIGVENNIYDFAFKADMYWTFINKKEALERVVVMQYTGLRDKNEKEIYEGDIVKYTFDSPNSLYATENGLKARISKVFWSDWRGSFAVGNSLANSDLFNYVRNGNRVEVAGNIYENPELLEVEE